MIISIVIPAYNATQTIERTIKSIDLDNNKFRNEVDLEVIIIDDGSDDSASLKKIIKNYKKIVFLKHRVNKGMCAARNTGIKKSRGSVVIILDSDDEFISNWLEVFRRIYQEWPKKTQVCFSQCRNQIGYVTSESPNFRGFLELKEILNEEKSGEYLPIFRGHYIRKSLYTDIGTKKSCGIISYIKFAIESGSFWITDDIIRIYYDNRAESISGGWTNQNKAVETVKCYKNLFKQYGYLYMIHAPQVLKLKKLKLSVYMKLSRERGYWKQYLEGASVFNWKETLVVGLMLLAGVNVSSVVAKLAKKIGLIRRYG